jgi:hypothetical protein
MVRAACGDRHAHGASAAETAHGLTVGAARPVLRHNRFRALPRVGQRSCRREWLAGETGPERDRDPEDDQQERRGADDDHLLEGLEPACGEEGHGGCPGQDTPQAEDPRQRELACRSTAPATRPYAGFDIPLML